MIKFIILLVLFVGWVMNIVAFTKCDFQMPIKAEIVRGIGIGIPPVGAVMGYLDIED